MMVSSGHVTASLLVGKPSASGRQNALAAALEEYRVLRRTIYAAKYLSDPDYRRKIARQRNKGESLHALRRDLLYAHEGTIRARHLGTQNEQAWCLTLATNAVIAWTTEYYGLASRCAAKDNASTTVLAHISRAHEHQLRRRDRGRTRSAPPHRLPTPTGPPHAVLTTDAPATVGAIAAEAMRGGYPRWRGRKPCVRRTLRR
jgi:hypothetical protein